jgi:N-acetylneuraminic acid mutarotase
MIRRVILWVALIASFSLSTSCSWFCSDDPDWVYRHDMITGRGSSASVIWQDQLYVIAGHHTTGSSVANRGKYNESYDPSTDDWTSHAVAPHDSYNACAAAVGDYLYVFGGVNVGGNYSRNSVDRYDAVGNTWTSDFDVYPYSGIEGARAISYGGRIYILGGRYYIAGSPYEYRSNVYAFDPAAPSGSRFTELAAMPEARADFAAVLVDDEIHCIAGSGASGELSRHDTYDITANTWITGLEPLPESTAAPAGGEIGGKILLVTGGWISGSPGHVAESLTYEYDISGDSWAEKDSPHTARCSAAYGVIGGRLYLAGGYDWSNITTVTNCTTDLEEATPGENPGLFP